MPAGTVNLMRFLEDKLFPKAEFHRLHVTGHGWHAHLNYCQTVNEFADQATNERTKDRLRHLNRAANEKARGGDPKVCSPEDWEKLIPATVRALP